MSRLDFEGPREALPMRILAGVEAMAEEVEEVVAVVVGSTEQCARMAKVMVKGSVDQGQEEAGGLQGITNMLGGVDMIDMTTQAVGESCHTNAHAQE